MEKSAAQAGHTGHTPPSSSYRQRHTSHTGHTGHTEGPPATGNTTVQSTPSGSVEMSGMLLGNMYPAPEWISAAEAIERLSERAGRPITPEVVKRACRKYRHRIEGRTTDQEELGTIAPDPDHAAKAGEIECVWVYLGNSPKRWMVYRLRTASVDAYNLNVPGLNGKRGRGMPPGTVIGPRSEREQTGTDA